MKVVSTDRHRLHDPAWEVELGRRVPHRETAARADRILDALGADQRFVVTAPTEHGEAPVTDVHDPALVRFLADAWDALHVPGGPDEVVPDVFLAAAVRQGMGEAPLASTMHAQIGRWCFETATPLVAGTFAAARAAVDVALTAADIVLDGDPVAYALCRPPGHHAPRAAYGGYCYFNNAAIAAHHLVRETGGRVTVLDVDYHHGNGTQQIFYDRADVQYVSLHGDPHRAYPYFAGFADERGAGAGRGSTLNLPLPAGLEDDGYLAALGQALEAIDTFGPAALVVSLGVDTWKDDPIADLAVSQEGFARCGAAVGRLGVPMVVVQEGGYDVSAIGENVRRWLLGAAGA